MYLLVGIPIEGCHFLFHVWYLFSETPSPAAQHLGCLCYRLSDYLVSISWSCAPFPATKTVGSFLAVVPAYWILDLGAKHCWALASGSMHLSRILSFCHSSLPRNCAFELIGSVVWLRSTLASLYHWESTWWVPPRVCCWHIWPSIVWPRAFLD